MAFRDRRIEPLGMKQRVRHRPLPCKKRPPRFVTTDIYAECEGYFLLLSTRADFAKPTLSDGEDPKTTPFVLVGPLLLLLPLLFTFTKFEVEFAERVHQLFVEPVSYRK